MGPFTPQHEPDYSLYEPEPRWKEIAKKLIAPLAAIGAVLAKFKFIALGLFKFKLFATSGTMLVSIAAYAWIWGWRFAVGFVLLILVHEMGHVLELRRQGVPASAPLFIPFLGAVVALEQPQVVQRQKVRSRCVAVIETARIAARPT